ncbi:hypothetical protein HYDPIDRAFT_28552 [Hydnomerulius pinastri MD-312]|uniref:PAS domain-containing protein n=1 Tax=Hydnomerulius pinastri MD-312 TaxID=994086 RepID=A0A0C9WG11_9AGAM|nr:hypothetical protein HYDPIDRAFT_28552 [Hydnomerulius pinastri MD-312]
MDSNTPRVSCIAIVDFSEDARWVFVTESVTELLGYEPRDVIGRPALDIVHPDEFPTVRQLHYDTIRQDKAAVIAYLRLKHKDPFKGYLLCAVSRTVVHNVLVGSVSLAVPGAKAFQNASTAQEVVVVTPTAKNFEFRRWGDPSPMPPSPLPNIPALLEPSADNRESSGSPKPISPPVLSFWPLPSQSLRSAFILDRFSIHCPIQYCSNDHLLSTTTVMGRSFFDFVAFRSDEIVRSWIDVIKAWGVNERGQPSDGGFGYGKFYLLPKGRDARNDRLPEATTAGRRREFSATSRSHSSRSQLQTNRSRLHSSPFSNSVTSPDDEVTVDAIFSGHSDGILVILRTTSLSPHA